MRHRHAFALPVLLGIGVLGIFYSLATSPAPVRAQSDCTNYNLCPALDATSGVMVQGPITYWFDNDRINA